MKQIKRTYVYKETVDYILEWGQTNNVRTPNNRANFPAYLEAFINKAQK